MRSIPCHSRVAFEKGWCIFESPYFSWERKAVRAPWIDFAVPLVVIASEYVSANVMEDGLLTRDADEKEVERRDCSSRIY